MRTMQRKVGATQHVLSCIEIRNPKSHSCLNISAGFIVAVRLPRT